MKIIMKKAKYLNHPVLTVSQKTAAEYCDWRTQMIRYLWRNDLESLYKVQMADKIEFRLPTWMRLKSKYSF